MTMSNHHKVIIVFDPSYGLKLIETAQNHHVWIIRSPANQEAVCHYASTVKDTDNSLESGVTAFEETEFDADFMSDLWDHHGEYAHSPPLSEIEVVGRKPTQAAIDALSDYGFRIVSQEGNNFTATQEGSEQPTAGMVPMPTEQK